MSRLLFLLLIPLTIYAQNATDAKIDKHSAIVEADGYVFISEDKTPSQLRQEAMAEAKRQALEKGQMYIKSVSKVENYQLTFDLIQSESEGFVKVLESKDYGINDNRYRIWIKAEIEYQPKSPDQEGISVFADNPSAPLTVSVRTEKTVYQQGQQIKIYLHGSKDFYARVLYTDALKQTWQLLPNQHRTDNFFPGGKDFVIPGPDDKFTLEVSPPFGQEKIIVYASTAPQGDISLAAAGESLYQVETDIAAVAAKTRGVIIKEKQAGDLAAAEFFETSCNVQTEK
jgi:hypothetical protein